LTERVAKIGAYAVEGQRRIGFGNTFLQHYGVAEPEQRIPPRVFSRHARGNVIFRPHRQVRLQFGLDLALYR
jgi:hypothetical protein